MSALRGVCCGGCLLLGVSAPGGCLLFGGVASQHALRQTPPPCEQNDKQVQKYYLGHNFVAAGNNSLYDEKEANVHGKLMGILHQCNILSPIFQYTRGTYTNEIMYLTS